MFQFFRTRYGYDANEKAFLNKAQNQKLSNKGPLKTIVVQAADTHYVLALYAQVINEFKKKHDCYVIGLWPAIFTLKQKHDLIHPIRLLYSRINLFLIKRKWFKLYRSVGIVSFYSLINVAVVKKIKFAFKAFHIWRSIRSKEDLVSLSIDGLYCGDLIYDTYLRYRIKPTVSISDWSLPYYIYKCLCVIEAIEQLVKRENISDYFSSYSTYIQHGIPVRIFLRSGINVYTSGNVQQRFKRLSNGDPYHTAVSKNYWQTFQTLEDQKDKIEKGKRLLTNKFKGVIDTATSYMKESAYQDSATFDNSELNFDGVVFLHDFYDSPHIYSSMLFSDFYEWVEHTLKLIIKYNLNVAVKPHPNQVSDSKKDIELLQKKYSSIKWINPKTSNAKILKSGIKFGVSIYGTVLHELAFHGINPVCAGDNPHASFDFIHFPKSISEYDDMIINYKNLKLPDNYIDQVASFYYMHNVHPKEDFLVDESIFGGYNITNGSSKLLLHLLMKTNNNGSQNDFGRTV